MSKRVSEGREQPPKYGLQSSPDPLIVAIENEQLERRCGERGEKLLLKLDDWVERARRLLKCPDSQKRCLEEAEWLRDGLQTCKDLYPVLLDTVKLLETRAIISPELASAMEKLSSSELEELRKSYQQDGKQHTQSEPYQTHSTVDGGAPGKKRKRFWKRLASYSSQSGLMKVLIPGAER